MNTGAETRLALLLMLAMQVLVVAGAIGVLSRMGPAMNTVLAKKISSAEAVEQMLASLTMADPEDRGAAFLAALDGARSGATDVEERNVITEIERESRAVLSGASADAASLVLALRRFSALKHASMHSANETARRLASAGAWAAVLLGLSGFAVGVLAYRRLLARVVAPVNEISSVLAAWRSGNEHRRYSARAAATDLNDLGTAVNDMINTSCRESTERAETLAAERAALLTMLDAMPEPTAVLDRSGRILAANAACERAVSGSDGSSIRTALADAASGRAPVGVRSTDARGRAWLCSIGAQESR